MSSYTYSDDSFSDLHKDAYGFRPNGEYYSWLKAATPAEKQDEWDGLIAALERTIAREQMEEQAALVDFEARIAQVLETGAKDRQQAVRWLYESLAAPYDYDYADFQMGLPYGTFKKELQTQ